MLVSLETKAANFEDLEAARFARPGSTSYGDLNGSMMHHLCTETDDDTMKLACSQYIAEFEVDFGGSNKGVGGYTFCVPDGGPNGQMKRVVTKWLVKRRMQNSGTRGDILVAKALGERFPCSKN
jgi:hypothetical protein